MAWVQAGTNEGYLCETFTTFNFLLFHPFFKFYFSFIFTSLDPDGGLYGVNEVTILVFCA